MLEFGIDDEPVKIEGEWHLIGRCGGDISVGDRFTKFFPYRKIGSEGIEGVDYVYDAEVPIDLTVTRIHAYGKELKSWSAGLTAKLVLSGDGDNLIPNAKREGLVGEIVWISPLLGVAVTPRTVLLE